MAHSHSEAADALLDKEFKVLDHGFVRLVDYMGSDSSIVQAARVSYGSGTKKVREDRQLIRYLLRHRHTTPFEMVEFKFHVKLPIFVARQWIRHRSASVNEYSARYSVMEDEFYLPDPDQIRKQSKANRQGSSAEMVDQDVTDQLRAALTRTNDQTYTLYKDWIDGGIARELARINLPIALYTQWYWKIDLHNLMHFLRLRMDHHAQYEIRVYAEVMAQMVEAVCPVAWEAFCDYVRDGVHFSGPELAILRDRIADIDLSVEELVERGLSKGEAREFRDKLAALRTSERLTS